MSRKERQRRERSLEAARGYLMLDMPRHALEQLDAVSDPDQQAFEIEQLRGESLQRQEDYPAALKAFRRALLENPNSVTVLMGMGWCYKRIGQLPRAINALKRAYRVDPDEPIVLYNLSCYFALAGDKQQALSWLGRALRMESSLRNLIADESDFDQLRDDPDFQFVATADKQPDAT